MNLKYYLQLILLLASIALRAILARDLHIHKSSRFPFPQHLLGSRKGHNIEGIHSVKTYLQRYGYLSNNVESNANTFDDHLELAVKIYQKFFHLNVSGILDAETLHLMSQPRCAVPDFFNNGTSLTEMGEDGDHPIGTLFKFFPGRPKWPSSKYSLKYAFIHSFPYEYKEPVVNALKTWASYTRFKFSEASEAQADIKISFEEGDHGDGYPFGARTLAHAFGPGDGRLHFNRKASWSIGAQSDKYDVGTVALHEIGHILGLAHSSFLYAVMWSELSDNTVKYLENDDVDGLWQLYEGWPEDDD